MPQVPENAPEPRAGSAWDAAPEEIGPAPGLGWSRGASTGLLPQLADRSPNAWVCPFLRSVGADAAIASPMESPDPANRCAALRDPVPQSLRQQELVCLTSGHVNCPRYLRGAVATAEPVPAAPIRASGSMSPAILGSIAVVVMAFAASVGFVLSRGDFELTAAATPGPSASVVAAAASPSTGPTAGASVAPSPTVAASPSAEPTAAPTAAPTPTPSAAPTPTPEPTAAPTATPEPTPEPTRRSNRYDLLKPCPNTPDCWIYTVRSGDNLFSIANYFGVPLETVYDRNPWTRTRSLRAGQELRLPPPTR